jgi:predicted DCC family thiol-disulfide oxidoreductase YuxK
MKAALISLQLEHGLLLFDGVCNSCHYIVSFILTHDRKQLFYFMPLQSNAGKKVLQFYDLPSDELSTLVFVYKSKSYTYSAAVFKILSLLEWPWRVFCLFSIFPKVLTDFCYRFYANHRYEWFGKLESCHIPSPEERSRFLGGDD